MPFSYGPGPLGLADIEFAREACKTSLTSTAIRYAELTDDAIAVILSTGRVIGSRGDSYDNALAETIDGLCKTELIHRRAPWKTRESVELATLEWVAWYNHHRLMEPLGYIPPAEAEANYYRQFRNAADVSALT